MRQGSMQLDSAPPNDALTLRKQMLIVRAEIERTELATSLHAIRQSVSSSTRCVSMLLEAFGFMPRSSAASAEPKSWIRMALDVVRQRPWLLSTAVALLSRRRAWQWGALAAVTAGCAWFASGLQRRNLQATSHATAAR